MKESSIKRAETIKKAKDYFKISDDIPEFVKGEDVVYKYDGNSKYTYYLGISAGIDQSKWVTVYVQELPIHRWVCGLFENKTIQQGKFFGWAKGEILILERKIT